LRSLKYLCVCGALLVAGLAGAASPRESVSPRDSVPRETIKAQQAAAAAAESVAPVDWTRRLVGRFKVDGVIHHQEIIDFNQFEDAPPDPENPDDAGSEVRGAYLYLPEASQPVEGKVDCIAFAAGPGLQCVLHVVWPETWRITGKAQLGGVSDLTPAMVLAGFSPTTAATGIRVLLVDKRGLGHPGALLMNGNSAGARPACVNKPGMMGCDQRFTITAKADAKTIFVNLTTNVRFSRSKLDRKRFLEKVPDSPGLQTQGQSNRQPAGGGEGRTEKSTEWVTETLDVAFVLRLDQTAADAADASTAAAPAPASR
jgi:hypothetical protein